ncbi:hypothetical protein GCM10022200_17460 [Microbacterium awajiense]|uniref:ThuA-like domain-containing protein n=1 Tax=Microbacterium awajiense TaxID=415214 RepID=A0ABP7AKL1_9MICO
MRALIASGTGRYADPWHPFAQTSPLLAEILHGEGFSVVIDDDVDTAMRRLDGIDLLVVNAGDPWRGDDRTTGAPADSIAGLDAALDGGMGVLAIHAAVASLRDYPAWAPAIGGMWIPSGSFHPPAGPATVSAGALPDGTALSGFEVVDERYCRLQQLGERHVVAEHSGPAGAEPTAWVRTAGSSRVAVDVLGHDEASYESVGHVRLIAALARWACPTP